MKEIELNLIRSFEIHPNCIYHGFTITSDFRYLSFAFFSIVDAIVDHCDSDVFFVMTVNLDSVPLLLQLMLLLSVMFGVVLQ